MNEFYLKQEPISEKLKLIMESSVGEQHRGGHMYLKWIYRVKTLILLFSIYNPKNCFVIFFHCENRLKSFNIELKTFNISN